MWSVSHHHGAALALEADIVPQKFLPVFQAVVYIHGFPVLKNPPANAGDIDTDLIRGSGKIPWRGKWQPTPVFLPGKPRGQGSLAGYRPWNHIELDTTKTTLHARMYVHCYYSNNSLQEPRL